MPNADARAKIIKDRELGSSPCLVCAWLCGWQPEHGPPGAWQVKPQCACCSDPVTCCIGSACPCCTVWHQRQEILELAKQPYICCGGRFAEWGCCLCGRCGRSFPTLEKPFDAPNLGLCVEAFCCTPFAIVGNRFLIQDEFDRVNDEWDDCICCCFAGAQMAQHAEELRSVKLEQAGRFMLLPTSAQLLLPAAQLLLPAGYGATWPGQQGMRG
mmetsp:Transcript_5225/g.6488  ORF Transcript_5225/g.6488 Transcript_5225/m.6488 type:complete len:213 (+) Transcript_5225:115-753(+)